MLQTNIKKPLTITGLVIGISLIGGFGGSYFLAQQLNEKTEAVVAARVASARAATLAPRITALKQQEDEALAYERILALLLPNQEQLLQVPRDIEALGKVRGVEARFRFLGSPTPGTTAPATPLPFTMTATGNAMAIAEFLKDVELTNPRYTVNISLVEFGTLPGDTVNAKADMTGNVYYQ